jgi:hypothetical protein
VPRATGRELLSRPPRATGRARPRATGRATLARPRATGRARPFNSATRQVLPRATGRERLQCSV